MQEKDFLLVIDMQNAYLPGNPWGCERMEEAVVFTLSLLQEFPEEQTAFTRFIPPENPEGAWRDYNAVNRGINRNAWMNEYVEPLKPYLTKANTYTKSVYSCCKNQALYKKLSGYERIYITGVVAECCVLSTVLELVDMGKKVVWMEKGIAGESRQKEKEVIGVLGGMSPLHILFESGENV